MSENTFNSVTEKKFKTNDTESQKNDFKKHFQYKISPREIRESNISVNTKEKCDLIGFSTNSDKQLASTQKNPEKKRDRAKPVSTQTELNPVKSNRKSNKGWHVNGAYFFLLMLFPLVFRNKKPNKVQIWAARNKAKSRTLLVIAKILLAATSVGLGFLLGAPFSLPLLLLSVGILIITFETSEYWKRKNQLTNKKKLGLLWVFNTSISFGFFSLGGMLQNGFDFSQWSMRNGLLEASTGNPENGFVHHPVQMVVLTILLTAVIAALLYCLIFLSCMLYCSGSEFLGASLFILGGYILMFGFIYFISQIFRKENETKDDKRKRLVFSLVIGGALQIILLLSSLISS